MSDVNWEAVARRLEYIDKQITETREMIAVAASGAYSPFMSSERFEEQFELALKTFGAKPTDICIFNLRRPHRCSRCESFVEHFMKRPRAESAA